MRTLLIGQSLALICFTVVVPIEVIYAKESLGTTSAGFGVLLSAWGAGIVIGSLLFVALKNRSGFALIVVSTALIGLAYLGMSQAGTLVVACAMSVVGGAGNGVQWVAVMTALQEATPTEYQARMSGLLESIGAAMPGVGYLLGGVLDAARLPAHRVRVRRHRRCSCWWSGRWSCAPVRVRPRRRPARPSGGA